MSQKIIIGVDIGGTSIKGASISLNGEIMDRFSMPVEHLENQNTTIEKLVRTINSFIAERGISKNDVVGIGCGVPGAIDSLHGNVDYSNNLGWSHLPIVSLIEKGTGLPVRITNDANAATLGEARFGAGKTYKNVIMLTLGTGVGGGIIINGKLYEGNEGKGAELGHSLLIMNGEQCTCGRKGCIEAYASATALIRQTKKAMESHKNSSMWNYANQLGKVDGRVSFLAARAGDEPAQQVVDEYIMYLSESIMNYCNIFRPDAVILSGGIANEGKYLFDRLTQYCAERDYGFHCTPAVKILPAELGYLSGMIGAACLMID